tara:strand:- start:463 stop:621 length:159 start_codon:yes stop_codon:yes gene_type:complete
MGLVEYFLIANTVLIGLLFIYTKSVVSHMEERISKYLYTLEVDRRAREKQKD